MGQYVSVENHTFTEFNREIVLDVQRNRAFFVTPMEREIVEFFRAPGTFSGLEDALKGRYDAEEVRKGVKELEGRDLVLLDSGNKTLGPRMAESVHHYNLTLNVSQTCNLRCRYCYAENIRDPNAAFMDQAMAKKAVDFIFREFPDMEQLSVAFYGGEPLLNFPVMKLATEYAAQRGETEGLKKVKFHVTTNGTLLKDEVYDLLSRYIYDVSLSIDGPNAEDNRNRLFPDGGEIYDILKEKLGRLLSLPDVTVSTSSVLTCGNRMTDIYAAFSRYDLTDIKIAPAVPFEGTETVFSLYEKEKYKADLRVMANACMDELLDGRRPKFYRFEIPMLMLWQNMRKQYFCPAGTERFAVHPSGDIFPCGPAASAGQYRIGNIEGGVERDEKESFLSRMDVENLDRCRGCPIRYLCLGGCPVQRIDGSYGSECDISFLTTRLAIAIYLTVKERDEMKLVNLVDSDLFKNISEILPKARNTTEDDSII